MNYYYEHQDKIKEQNKKYQENNKEKIQLANKEKYQKNKEKILENQKEIIMCECGAHIRKAGMAEHCKSKKHQDYITADF
jgi:glucosamine 6-phosphate synthetase-like amidotransferase/phosphosugar isomerase protein